MELISQPRKAGAVFCAAVGAVVRKMAASGTWVGGRLAQASTLTVRSPITAWPPTAMVTWVEVPSTLFSTPSVALVPGSQVLGIVGAVVAGGGAVTRVDWSGVAGAGWLLPSSNPDAGVWPICVGVLAEGGGVAGAGAAGGAATTGGAGGMTVCAQAGAAANTRMAAVRKNII